ncbi:MAG: glycosyltransferase family 1 protein [Bacteroidota bacterium]
MRTVFFFRKANAPWHHSIEELFDTIIAALPAQVGSSRYVMKHNSIGLWKRIFNAIDSAFHQAEVNHITGDVHYIAVFMKKRKTILTIHDLRILSSGGGLRLAVLKFFWFTMPAMRVRYITVISEFIKQELIQKTGINAEKILVVHDCISSDIKPFPREFNDACPVIIQIGTTPNKNLHRVIPALEGLNLKLVIIGKLTDEHTALLTKYGIRYENFFNLPYNEVLDHYRNADIVLFASLYEGFGLPILEANAIGRPVITGNNTSLPEVAGDAAMVIDVENTEAIREAVIQLINDSTLRNTLIIKGFKNVKRFQPEEIGMQFATIYEQLLKE